MKITTKKVGAHFYSKAMGAKKEGILDLERGNMIAFHQFDKNVKK